jgi:hypothetical protein
LFPAPLLELSCSGGGPGPPSIKLVGGRGSLPRSAPLDLGGGSSEARGLARVVALASSGSRAWGLGLGLSGSGIGSRLMPRLKDSGLKFRLLA